MSDFSSSAVLFLTLLRSLTVSIRLNCYSNAALMIASDALLYNQTTLNSCQCLSTQKAFAGFQYDHSTNSCYVFGSNYSTFNLRVNVNSQVCFVNQLSTSYMPTTAATTVSSQPRSPFNYISTSVSTSRSYREEAVNFENTVALTDLSIVISMRSISSSQNPRPYDNTNGIMRQTINSRSTPVTYTFEIISGRVLPAGNWTVTTELYSSSPIPDASNDTYTMQIGSYQVASGHF